MTASSCECIKELRSNESLKTQNKEEELLRCSWSSNKPGLLAGGNSLGSVILWDTTKADAKDQVVGEWKAKSKTSPAEEKRSTEEEDKEQIYVCEFCPTKGVNEILIGGEDTLREVDVETMKTKQSWTCEPASEHSIGGPRNPEKRNYVFDSCFGFDGIVIAVATADGAVHLRDRRVSKVVASLLGHNSFATGCSFSFANRSLASCSGDGTVSLWDCRMWKVRAGFKASAQSVYGCTFGSQISEALNAQTMFQEQVVTWGVDGSIRWWEISDAVRDVLICSRRFHFLLITRFSFLNRYERYMHRHYRTILSTAVPWHLKILIAVALELDCSVLLVVVVEMYQVP